MRRALAVLAMTLFLPGAAAAQVYINVQNCGPVQIAVGPLDPALPAYVPATSVPAGQTGRVRCDAAACWLQITYYVPGATRNGTYRHLYTTDRCTRGPEDAAAETQPLADIGTCGC